MAERRVNWLLFLPPLIFALVAGAFYFGMRREAPDELDSVLRGQPVPQTELAGLLGPEGVDNAALSAPGVKLVNFWASWCGPCRVEHPTLTALAAEGVTLIGINYKDDPQDAKAFLAELGNPYTVIGADTDGRTGINWGIYGVPETFVVDDRGVIIERFPGPITGRVLKERIRPAMERARTGS